MKANEFVKKFWWDKAREVVVYRDKHAKKCNTYIFIGGNGGYSTSESYTTDGLNVNVNDLKHLVESHELVEQYGGLDRAKLHIEYRKKSNSYILPNLVKAIADVESCL